MPSSLPSVSSSKELKEREDLGEQGELIPIVSSSKELKVYLKTPKKHPPPLVSSSKELKVGGAPTARRSSTAFHPQRN